MWTTSCSPGIRRAPSVPVIALVCACAVAAYACSEPEDRPGGGAPARADDAGARAAFLAVYPVFMHPRCVNCHPAGDAPLQGDDSRPHAQNVVRGPHGWGVYAQKCASCHQSKNLPGANMPPGNPTWRLPPPGMPMVFEGRSPAQLARQLRDPKENGGKTLDQLVHHVMEDRLVLWGWSPGDGRTTPPLRHKEFAAKFKEWVDRGAAVPAE